MCYYTNELVNFASLFENKLGLDQMTSKSKIAILSVFGCPE